MYVFNVTMFLFNKVSFQYALFCHLFIPLFCAISDDN